MALLGRRAEWPRLIMVGSGLTSFNQRIEESVRLMHGASTPGSRSLFKSGTNVGSAKVQLGQQQRSVAGGAARPRSYSPAGVLSRSVP